MNYLDFSRKIMLYLQLRGLVFSCIVTEKSDMTLTATNKNGIPYALDIESAENVKFSAMRGNGIVTRINSINYRGDVDWEIVHGYAILTQWEGIEEKIDTVIKEVIGTAVKFAFSVKDGEVDELKATLGTSLPANMTVEEANEARISMNLLDVGSDAFRVLVTESNEVEITVAIVIGLLLRLAVSSRLQAEILATLGQVKNTAVYVTDGSEFSATIHLMIVATLNYYAGVTLETMGSSTLSELSTIIV